MKYVFLDGEKIDSTADVHRIFADTLGFPEYYGKNLDALHDALTDIAEPVAVVVVNTAALEEHLGRRKKGFLRLMEDLTEEKTGFRFLYEPFGE